MELKTRKILTHVLMMTATTKAAITIAATGKAFITMAGTTKAATPMVQNNELQGNRAATAEKYKSAAHVKHALAAGSNQHRILKPFICIEILQLQLKSMNVQRLQNMRLRRIPTKTYSSKHANALK